jgi:hypothetical protein
MKTTRALIRLGLGIVAAVAVAGGTMTFVKAFDPQTVPPGDIYGLVGITAGQTLELNVSNYALPDLDSNGHFPPCQVTLTLFDRTGHVLTTKDATVNGGQSDGISFMVPRSADTTPSVVTVGVPTYLRAQMYFHKPYVNRIRNAGGDSCASSAEVIGVNGETSLFINPALAVESLTSNHNETLVIDTDR